MPVDQYSAERRLASLLAPRISWHGALNPTYVTAWSGANLSDAAVMLGLRQRGENVA